MSPEIEKIRDITGLVLEERHFVPYYYYELMKLEVAFQAESLILQASDNEQIFPRIGQSSDDRTHVISCSNVVQVADVDQLMLVCQVD